jgi:hypothetical protein
MTTEQEPAPREPSEPSETSGPAQPGADEPPEATLSWRDRRHPTFTALTGFFTGLAAVILVPGVFAAVLGWFFDYGTADALFPLVLVTLLVPLVLVAVPRTRRFGLYMLLGIVVTAVVVAGVGGAVIWYMVARDG